MDRETVIALAEKAGLFIQEGAQDRLLFDAPIVDALTKFAELAKGDWTTIRVSLEDSPARIDGPFIELRLPDGCASQAIDAIKAAFREGEKSAKASIAKMLTP